MTELLAPAGSREALIAAVQNGANAVYLGVDEFNARRGARNFTLDELRGVVAYCHLRGVRVYLTLNTLVNDRELHALSSVAHGASEAGVDAIHAYIDAGVPPPNAPITVSGGWMWNRVAHKPFHVSGKGTNRPLYDTGSLYNDFDYEVVYD